MRQPKTFNYGDNNNTNKQKMTCAGAEIHFLPIHAFVDTNTSSDVAEIQKKHLLLNPPSSAAILQEICRQICEFAKKKILLKAEVKLYTRN